jgi:hypothetical protein
MYFKKAKWEEWENDYSVAKGKDKWIWQMGNLSFVFKQE